DDLEIRIAEEPGPSPNAGASRPSQGMAVAHPNQQRLALGRRLLPGLPQIGHPVDVVETAGLGLDQLPQLVELAGRESYPAILGIASSGFQAIRRFHCPGLMSQSASK